MSTVIKRTEAEHILSDVQEWRALHPEATDWDNDDIATWLIEVKGYKPQRQRHHREVAKKVAKALGKKKIRNAQGKRVSEYHSATFPIAGTKKQQTLWAERLTMIESFAHASIEGRHKQVEGLCRSMRNDADDINANNPNLKDNPIQLELDFSHVGDTKKKKKEPQTIPIETGPAGAYAKKVARSRPR